MALLLIAVTWMLLLALVAGLCRAARLGDAGELRPDAGADRAHGAARPRTAFTKSLRRRAGLHRA